MAHALIRTIHEHTEIMSEPFPEWVANNIDYLTKIDGWTLIDNYIPPIEEEP